MIGNNNFSAADIVCDCIFYKVGENDLLEMRPEDGTEENRLVYKIETVAGVMILSRVRVGINGVQDLLEPPITLSAVPID